MIVSLIRQTAEKQGIKNAHQLEKALNVSPTLAARLWSGKFEKIGMNTLDKLCALLRCQPSKLLRYDSDDSR